jgi:hypothetical protein
MNLELKIKMENKKEVTLDEKEAKELFEKLKEIFGTKEKEYVPYYPWRYYVYDNPVQPYRLTWTTQNGNASIYCSGVKA